MTLTSTHSGTPSHLPSSAQFVLHAPLLPPQAGLPLDVFWAVHDRNEALPSESFVVRTANATLVKAGHALDLATIHLPDGRGRS